MLEQILMHLNNWFVMPGEIYGGTYHIEDGSIELPFLQNGQYFRITGSVFNDGLHQYPAEGLTDEEFEGCISCLAIPKAVLEVAQEIEAWQAKNGAAAASPFQSESFGGYSYSKSTSVSATSGGISSWQDAFRGRLNQWRKL